MKILNASQIREADNQTIQEEQIPSVTLMERAAEAFSFWFSSNFPDISQTILICCGPGNNGGDGLAIARMLHERNYSVEVWIVATEAEFPKDFEINRQRLPPGIPIITITGKAAIPTIIPSDIILDALFGTGLSRAITGIFATVINKINASSSTVIAIDIPSGLYPEKQNNPQDTIIQAQYTICFEIPKLAFLLPQNEKYVGYWTSVPIGLSAAFLEQAVTNKYLITPDQVKKLLPARHKFSHKGTYGHALLLAGSFGKMGASVLAARACLRSGVGLLTVHCPGYGYPIMQMSAPEAMTLTDKNENIITHLPSLTNYQAIGIGPGLGKAPETKVVIRELLEKADIPLVVDADALNILALTILFDIRDIHHDQKNKTLTVPGLAGIRNAKYIAWLLLLGFSLLVIITPEIKADKITLLISGAISGVVIWLGNEKRSEYFYALAADGMMILQFLLLLSVQKSLS